MTNEILAWAWVIAVDLAVVVGGISATYDRPAFPVLRAQHVAAATIVGVFGWESAVNVLTSLIVSAGAFDPVDIAFLSSQAIFAVAAGVMVTFVMRRRRWAVVLGIGLALARFTLAILAVANTASLADGMETSQFISTALFILLTPATLLVAIWLFVDPFLRGQLSWRSPKEPTGSMEPMDPTDPTYPTGDDAADEAPPAP